MDGDELKAKNRARESQKRISDIANSPNVEHPTSYPAITPKLAKALTPTQDELNELFGRNFNASNRRYDPKKAADLFTEFLRDTRLNTDYAPDVKRFGDNRVGYRDLGPNYDPNSEFTFFDFGDDGSIQTTNTSNNEKIVNKYPTYDSYFDDIIDTEKDALGEDYKDEYDQFYSDWRNKFRGL